MHDISQLPMSVRQSVVKKGRFEETFTERFYADFSAIN